MIVTGTAPRHATDMAWLRRQARERNANVRINDVTGQYACFALWGAAAPARSPQSLTPDRPQ